MFQSLSQTYERNLPTKVLLVCTYNINGRLITHDVFYKLFSQYGQVNKILIFEKAKVWKTFIEFEDIQNAMNAKNMLNNYILFPDGSQIQVFYSNINQLQFKSFLNYNGVDYQNLKNNIQQQQQQQQTLSTQQLKKQLSKENNTNNILENVDHQYSKSCQANQSTKSSFSDLNLSQQEIPTNSLTNNIFDEILPSVFQQDETEQKSNQSIKEKSNPFQLFTNKESPLKFLNQILSNKNKTNNFNNNTNNNQNLTEMNYFNNQINNLNLNTQFNNNTQNNFEQIQQQQNSFFNFNSGNKNLIENDFQMNYQTKKIEEKEEMQDQINNYVNPLFLLQNQQSSVLFLRDIFLDENSIKLLYKIFNNFGNVLEIIYIKNKKQTLIEFQNIQHASLAKDFLYAKFFLGKKLKIFFSNYQTLNQRAKKNDNTEIYHKGIVEDFRYKESINTKQINAPTNYIHIANIPTQIYSTEALASLFSRYGMIEDIQLIQKSIKHMCVIKFSNVQDSISAFDMHNQYYFGRRLVLSFTRIKF